MSQFYPIKYKMKEKTTTNNCQLLRLIVLFLKEKGLDTQLIWIDTAQTDFNKPKIQLLSIFLSNYFYHIKYSEHMPGLCKFKALTQKMKKKSSKLWKTS